MPEFEEIFNSEIIIRANGGTNEGLGHLYRSIAISQCIPNKLSCTYVTNYTDFHRLCNLNTSHYILKENEDEVELYGRFKNLKIIILDGYSFNTSYQRRLKEQGYKIIYVDDLASEFMFADIVINHSPGFSRKDYNGIEKTEYLLGPRYSLVRRDFLDFRKAPKNNQQSILVAMGGSDQYNISEKILKSLDSLLKNKTVNVVVGNNYNFKIEVETFENIDVRVFQNLSSNSISHLIEQSYIGILPASTVLYEYLMSGKPVLCGYYVENQIKVYNHFVQNKLVFPLGNLLEPLYNKLKNGLDNFKIDPNYIYQKGFDSKSHDRIRTILTERYL